MSGRQILQATEYGGGQEQSRGRLECEAPHYCSYLLRVWQTGEGAAWRATLESVTTGERRSFAGLSELAVFLQDEFENQ